MPVITSLAMWQLRLICQSTHRQVFAIKRAMLAAGAETAAMTGSGPTVFGLFRDKAAAEAAHSAIAFPGAQVFLTEFV